MVTKSMSELVQWILHLYVVVRIGCRRNVTLNRCRCLVITSQVHNATENWYLFIAGFAACAKKQSTDAYRDSLVMWLGSVVNQRYDW